jgi:uncharacterized membrane protein YgaE (UPF0421/DUF939 family)
MCAAAHPQKENDGPASKKAKLGKAAEEFRNYGDSDRQSTVERHYRLMRTHQTYAFVQRMHEKYTSFDHAQMEIREAFDSLGGYVDSSDPDSEFPNIEVRCWKASVVGLAMGLL